MDADITLLEQKVEKVVAFCQTLREENRVLHHRIDSLENEKSALTEKIDVARSRLEALVSRLPEE